MPHSAIVSDDRKVIHFYERPDISMLFDLAGDEGEVKSVASQDPDTHRRLHDEMMRYFEGVGARIPKVNPDYDPEAYRSNPSYQSLETETFKLFDTSTDIGETNDLGRDKPELCLGACRRRHAVAR